VIRFDGQCNPMPVTDHPGRQQWSILVIELWKCWCSNYEFQYRQVVFAYTDCNL
jgi:hypothetical protein